MESRLPVTRSSLVASTTVAALCPQPFVEAMLGTCFTQPSRVVGTAAPDVDVAGSPPGLATAPQASSSLGVSASFLRRFRKHSDLTTGMTTGDVCQKLVLPHTEAGKCCYVDLVEKKKDPEGRPLVGKSTVFVSHAWRYSFDDVVSTMLAHAEDEPGHYYWFDLFTNNQWATKDLPQDFYANTFQARIKAIGKVLLVLTPWNDPVPLTRAWCLWEILTALLVGATLEVRLPHAQRKLFEEALLADCTSVVVALSNIQAERAEASYPRDKDMIFEAVRSSVTFGVLNQRVKEALRDWLFKTGEEAIRRAAREGSIQRQVHVMQEVGSMFTQLGRLTRATTVLREAVEMSSPPPARACRILGLCLRDQGDYESGAELMEQALVLYAGQSGMQLEMASCYEGLGATYRVLAKYERAMQCFQKSLDMRIQQSAGKESVNIASSYDGLGGVSRVTGKYEAAIRFYSKGLEIRLRTAGAHHPDVAASYNNLGNAAFNMKDYDKALEYYGKSLPILLEVFGLDHPGTAGAYSNMASAHQGRGRADDLDEAIALCTKALDVNVRALGHDSLKTAQSSVRLGTLHLQKGQHELAEKHLKLGLDIEQRLLGAGHASLADTHHTMAELHQNKGDLHAAKKSLQLSLSIKTKAREESLSTAASHEALAAICSQLKDDYECEEHWQAAFNMRRLLLGEEDDLVAQTERQLLHIQRKNGSGGAPSLGVAPATVTNMIAHLDIAPENMIAHSDHARVLAPLGSVSNCAPTSSHRFSVQNKTSVSSHRQQQPQQAQMQSISSHRQQPPQQAQMQSISSHRQQQPAQMQSVSQHQTQQQMPSTSQHQQEQRQLQEAIMASLSRSQPEQMISVSQHREEPMMQMMSSTVHANGPQAHPVSVRDFNSTSRHGGVRDFNSTSRHGGVRDFNSTSRHGNRRPRVRDANSTSRHMSAPRVSDFNAISRHIQSSALPRSTPHRGNASGRSMPPMSQMAGISTHAPMAQMASISSHRGMPPMQMAGVSSHAPPMMMQMASVSSHAPPMQMQMASISSHAPSSAPVAQMAGTASHANSGSSFPGSSRALDVSNFDSTFCHKPILDLVD